ncbi:MAG: hypothetical protein EXS55_04100 [Candidatus Magasanikbacteria bacterium]|nr:hypothetical protein [Candidatus Magasanikbacteria bacterium]
MRFLNYNLWKAKRRLSSGVAFKRSLRRQLDSAWRGRYGTTPWYRVHIIRWTSALTTGVVLAGSVSTGAYAYVSPTVTDGTALYPVKQVLEQIEERVQRTPTAKARFYVKQIERREAEKTVLQRQAKQSIRAEAQIEKLEERLDTIHKLVSTSTFEANPKLKKKIEQRLQERQERLQDRAISLKIILETEKKRAREQAQKRQTQQDKKEEKMFERQMNLEEKKEERLKRVETRIATSTTVSATTTNTPLLKNSRVLERQRLRLEQQIIKAERQANRLTVSSSPRSSRLLRPVE